MGRKMRYVFVFFLMLAAAATVGCASASDSGSGPDVVFIVPGVGGGSDVTGIARSAAIPGRAVRVFSWGAPQPFIWMNFSDKGIHDDAESDLAGRIEHWRRSHPDATINLIGHSAGCGVILGALGRVPAAHVKTVILLSPSVSPTYDLNPALAHIDGKLHAFISDRDTVFLDWRTSNFGTYDRINTKAAGNVGFEADYPGGKLIEHPYDPAWESLGNDGGHFSSAAEEFVKRIVFPLLQDRAQSP